MLTSTAPALMQVHRDDPADVLPTIHLSFPLDFQTPWTVGPSLRPIRTPDLRPHPTKTPVAHV
jgi:hypothetical protein